MTTIEKIRTEIEQLKTKPLPFDGYDECVKYALSIIDKYAEQEPTTRHSCENCKILELLVDFELETICEDDGKDFEYCENNCDFKAPTKECYLQWADMRKESHD